MHFLVGGLQPPVADVLHHRVGEQEGILQHQPQAAAQIGLAHLADIASIDADAPRLDLVEAGQQVDDGGLARAGRPDQGDRLPGLRFQGHVLDDRHLRVVAEANCSKADIALDRRQRQHAHGRRALPGGVSMISKTRSAPASAAWIELYMFASWRRGWMKFCP